MSWHEEQLYPDVREALKIDRELYRGRTAFQEVRLFRNRAMGKVMTLDGVVQTTEADEFIYHEMLAHPPILAHGAAKAVLVIGGGDGGSIREVLRHPVERVVMVELDGEVVELCKRHLPGLSDGAFDDPRLELVIGDGAEFVAKSEERFDVVIVDSTDPIGPGLVLFQEPFYEGCRRLLDGRGILVTQNGVPFFQRQEYDDTGTTRSRLFRHSGFYFMGVPTYFGGDMALGWASDAIDLAGQDEATLAARYAAWGAVPRYYNPQVHRGAFAVPNYLKEGGPQAGCFAA